MPGGPDGPGGGVLLALCLAYGIGLLAARRRGRSWPGPRAACWYAAVALAVPPVLFPPSGFVAHMAGHLLLGMVVPLLLVLAAPGTLALRALPATAARRLSRLFAIRPVRVLVHPLTAAALDAGGLWLLYTTPLYAAAMTHPALHLLVQTHVLGAGVLFAAAVAGVDPVAHRAGRRTRAVALLAFLAAHGILARFLYGHPPGGVPALDAQRGAELMYYGGDLADLALVVVFCAQWYDPARWRVGGRGHPRPWRLTTVD